MDVETTHRIPQGAQHQQKPPSYEELLEALREQTEVLRKAQAMLQQVGQDPAQVKAEPPSTSSTPAGNHEHRLASVKKEGEREAVSATGEPALRGQGSRIVIDLTD